MDEQGSGNRPEAEARRHFLKRMAAIAFAVPVVSSFTLDTAAYAEEHTLSGSTQQFSNQNHPNQRLPNQQIPNQQFPNQQFPHPGRP